MININKVPRIANIVPVTLIDKVCLSIGSFKTWLNSVFNAIRIAILKVNIPSKTPRPSAIVKLSPNTYTNANSPKIVNNAKMIVLKMISFVITGLLLFANNGLKIGYRIIDKTK